MKLSNSTVKFIGPFKLEPYEATIRLRNDKFHPVSMFRKTMGLERINKLRDRVPWVHIIRPNTLILQAIREENEV